MKPGLFNNKDRSSNVALLIITLLYTHISNSAVSMLSVDKLQRFAWC